MAVQKGNLKIVELLISHPNIKIDKKSVLILFFKCNSQTIILITFVAF